MRASFSVSRSQALCGKARKSIDTGKDCRDEASWSALGVTGKQMGCSTASSPRLWMKRSVEILVTCTRSYKNKALLYTVHETRCMSNAIVVIKGSTFCDFDRCVGSPSIRPLRGRSEAPASNGALHGAKTLRNASFYPQRQAEGACLVPQDPEDDSCPRRHPKPCPNARSKLTTVFHSDSLSRNIYRSCSYNTRVFLKGSK